MCIVGGEIDRLRGNEQLIAAKEARTELARVITSLILPTRVGRETCIGAGVSSGK